MALSLTIKKLSAVTLLCFFIACKNKENTKGEYSKSNKVDIDTATASLAKDTLQSTTVTTYPAINEEKKPGNSCFENDGLKYALKINISYALATKATITVTSNEIGSAKNQSASFNCAVTENKLMVKSVSNLPPAGDASQWLANKEWVIKNKKQLLIPFYAKNYDTNKWEERIYTFELCK